MMRMLGELGCLIILIVLLILLVGLWILITFGSFLLNNLGWIILAVLVAIVFLIIKKR